MREVIPQEVRQKVFERDGYKCSKCGSVLSLELDHIKPISEGGTNGLFNLQTLCKRCNRQKANFYNVSFFMHIRRIWYMHDYFQTLKNQIKWSTSSALGIHKKQIEKQVQDMVKNNYYSSQSISDKQRIKNEKEIELLKERIEQDENVIALLTDYLNIEYVPSKLQKPYFRKRI